ncbi:MAG: aminomethyl-transferring glycine dehydrogenase subunit GcvPB [Desulfovibrionaceae bacterium]|nr:aminomethyl-transferring glycine dehydrogenase subunit GcvPB [Desulfovibrionaceae bacterium]
MQTIFEKSVPGRHSLGLGPRPAAKKAADLLPAGLLRDKPARLPECSELDVVRHFTQLAGRNYSVDANFYPLGSCTMKYNPRICEEVSALSGFARMHPLTAQLDGGRTSQGAMQCLYELERSLCAITGMGGFTLQPMAGANGEFTGVSVIAAYHSSKGRDRRIMLIPDAAHGTNPASAAMAGFTVVNLESKDGMVDPAAVKEAIDKYGEQIAGLMMTCPNTLGLMELHLKEIVSLLHGIDALLYYDGANMNAILGKMRVGDAGFDVVHLNLHKTFSTPHGGGGPGAGPVGVCERLIPFLPSPRVGKNADGSYSFLPESELSIGKVGPFYGSFGVLLRALAYIWRLGGEGLQRVAEYAVLNANYLRVQLKDVLDEPFDRICMHEFVASAPHGMRALDIAKGLLERGMHAPTMYFPLLVHECLMPEPTETESKQTLDEFCQLLREIVAHGKEDPAWLEAAPRGLPVSRMDETEAARRMVLTEDM